MDEVADQILEVLENNEVTVAEAVAILTIIKHNLLTTMDTPTGVTIQ